MSLCDAKGELLVAIRIARAPEAKKATSKTMLAAEVSAVLHARPDLEIVKVADGALDNWEQLTSDALPESEETVDSIMRASISTTR